jgi:hypothetical protein
MNDIIEQVARKALAGEKAGALSFVKFNTEGSPMRRYRKVLFFCFVAGGSEPHVCIKTVRAVRDNETVAEGFEKLQALNALAAEAKCAALFPAALLLTEVDGFAYSVERAASGAHPGPEDADRVISAYTEFQRGLASHKKLVDRRQAGEKLISQLDITNDTRHTLQTEWADLISSASGNIALMPQHGDFTSDNVLVGKRGTTLVDCDSFMPEAVAGSDLFHFLRRAPQARSNFVAYMAAYRTALGEDPKFDRSDLFLWILTDALVKQEQGAPRELAETLPAEVKKMQDEFSL